MPRQLNVEKLYKGHHITWLTIIIMIDLSQNVIDT